MLRVESDSSKKSICLTQKTEKEDVIFLGGGVKFITMMVVVGSAPPHSSCSHAPARRLYPEALMYS